MSSSELKKALNTKKDISAVISIMCDELLLIRGHPIKSWRDRRLKYAPFEQYFPKMNLSKLDETESIQKLIYGYINSYGPVTENDIIWWSGLGKRKTQQAIKSLEEEIIKVNLYDVSHEYLLIKSQ